MGDFFNFCTDVAGYCIEYKCEFLLLYLLRVASNKPNFFIFSKKEMVSGYAVLWGYPLIDVVQFQYQSAHKAFESFRQI